MNVKRIYETVKYMTPRQWEYRLLYTARNKLLKRKPTENICVQSVKRLPMNYSNQVQMDDSQEADGLLLNKIPSISGRVEIFQSNIDWDMKDEEYRLVCFRVNSFRYLFTLSNAFKQSDDKKYIDKGFEFIDNWIANNFSLISGDKWNPYVIADRLMNWIGFVSEYCDDTKIKHYAKHIYPQAIELMKSIEYQLGANHLLSEGRALIAAGAFLNNGKMYQYGKKILQKEFNVQFLKDGGHYERSVSYHVESLQQYFEAIWIMNYLGDSAAQSFAMMIKEAYKFLNNMIGVNGEIPLFNDSAIDYPFYDARDFLATTEYLYKTTPTNAYPGDYKVSWNMDNFEKLDCNWNINELSESTGFLHHRFQLGDNKYSVYFDVGDNGPDSNLGHTHADSLSILLSCSNKGILVDSGVFTYQNGELRNRCRSTKAHNTLEIDDTDNAEVWSAFRVGRRGHSKVDYYENCNGTMKIRASSNGYTNILKESANHIRELIVDDQRGVLIVNDSLECNNSHKVTIRYHIGPDCSLQKLDEYTCFIDNRYLMKISEPIEISNCTVASKFGIVEESYCVESTFFTKNTKQIKTTIQIVEEMKK